MDNPAVLLPCLDHTKDFLDLAHLTHYLDSCLCMFYYVGLNTATKVMLSGHAEEDIASTTPEPQTSQPSSCCREQLPEPTNIAPEPEPQESSDQVCEPATSLVPEDILVEIEGLKGSPTHR
ncbi:Cell surface glycoprotein [Labeo rohita]|uniref:Cell surface glycoprotein n=1 Tax=Labeo rohita TaxID=84645 RepID=A0ABQ8LEJ1_LABRO|nr:Cell surface glycoprotein [Labeo rohita]